MASPDEQLHQAVQAALVPGPLQSEGLNFLQQLKLNPKEAWQAGLLSFLAASPPQEGSRNWVYKYPGETRLFGLQLVDAMLQLSTSSEEEVALVQSCYETTRQQLWDYIHREFLEGSGEQGLPYLRNKLVQTLFLLFFKSYPTNWPDFFSSFADLLRKHPQTNSPLHPPKPSLNPRITDLYLRLLHEVSAELSDALLRLNKPPMRLARDSELRDAIREQDAARIAQETFAIVAEALQGLSDTSNTTMGLCGKSAQECLEMGLRVVEDYVSWIDISLIVTPTWIQFLYQSLRLPNLTIRLAAADALICIVTKGMPPSNRIQLYNLLGLVDVLQALKIDNNSRKHLDNQNEEESQFSERLAKLLNGMGVELCKACDDDSVPLETRSSSLALATQLLPLLLSFVEDNIFASCAAVLPFVSAILSRYKKDKKMAPTSHMSDDKRTFLCQLLQCVVLKIRFPPDDAFDWEPPVLPGETEDEDMTAFLDRRRHLKTVVEAIASIDESIFQETVEPLICNVLDKCNTAEISVHEMSWQEVELAMFMLYNYGEAIKGSGPTGPRSYVLVPSEEIKKSNKNRDYHINYSQYPLSSLGTLLLKVSKSLITKHPHPSIALQWYECLTRYHEFVDIFPAVIQDVLPAFLDHRGLHHPTLNIRFRCCYLFYRFVVQGKVALQTHLNFDGWLAIINQLKDLTVIQAQLTTSATSAAEADALVKAALSPSMFDGQLYLFETIGIFVSFCSVNPEQQVIHLQNVLKPLVAGVRAEVAIPPIQTADLTNVLNIHHCILAIGAIAKGFPNLSPNTAISKGVQWPNIFKAGIDDILSVTKRLNDVRIIRDATRSSFHKIVATIGMEALSYVPALLSCLLEKLTQPELVEFLSFVGQLVHKYKENFGELLDSLLIPLVSKIIFFLDQPITGTDDVVCQSELRRGYFQLFSSIISSQLHPIFISQNNRPHLETIFKTIVDQIQSKDVLVPDLRYGFGALKNFCSVWLKPIHSTVPSPVEGFELFLYNQVIPLCFAVPSRLPFDWSDAESYLVLTEITTILKIVLTVREDEFVNFLTNSFFPSISCPSEKGGTLIKGLREASDSKPTRKPLVDFFGKNSNKQK
ncbi:hypothetical protein O181_013363 [Austropuccinia psidii MF-1]|uniref:Exportin-T n=1 Tax=Austropuccinia psidii MF-1 TaxID=1389203 RepID=A0A9Q3GN17_9BASI|nr:hypothetical protein [Austropuccinia psidii MF-1]